MTASFRTAINLLAIILILGACSSAPKSDTAPDITENNTEESITAPLDTSTASGTPLTPTATPTDLLFRYTYAVRMVESGQYEEAIPQLDMVIRALPTLAEAYYARGVSFIHEDNIDLGLADLDKAIELKENYSDAYHERGLLFLKLGKTNSAKPDLLKALELYEDEENIDGIDAVKNVLPID